MSFANVKHEAVNDKDWKGPSWDGVTVNVQYGGGSAETGPADFFTRGIGASMMSRAGGVTASEPSKLRFAIIADVTLRLNGVVVTVPGLRIGQGHVGWDYNWWIGGEGCRQSGVSASNPIKCTTTGEHHVEFNPDSLAHPENQFTASLA